MNENEDWLEHYGVKGMRWGVRRARGVDGRVGSSKKTSTEAKRAGEILQKAKKHGTSSLTNKELGDLNKRLQLEQQFSNLSPKKGNFKKGKAFTAEILGTANMGVQAYNLATSPAAKAVRQAMTQAKTKK